MRRFTLITLLILLGAATLIATPYTYIDARSGKTVSPAKVAAKLKAFDAVFFGEWHDNADIHAAEADLLERMFAKTKRLAASFEMFERDVQPALNAYLAGNSSEEEFLAASRPWPNYPTDYRPLVEFAKAHQLPCLAANVPRRLAGKAVRSGTSFVAELTDEERAWVASAINAPEGPYKENFRQTMESNGMHSAMGGDSGLDNLFYAQCVKDDTMAESIADFLRANPRSKVLHFNGDFHSREFLGTVERVMARDPELKLAVIAPLFAGDPIPLGEAAEATYYIVVPKPAEEIPPAGEE